MVFSLTLRVAVAPPPSEVMTGGSFTSVTPIVNDWSSVCAALSLTRTVTFHAAPGKGADLAQAMKARCEVSRQDAGCEQFEVFQSVSDPDKLVLLELWKDQAALDAHAKLQAHAAYYHNGEEPADLSIYLNYTLIILANPSARVSHVQGTTRGSRDTCSDRRGGLHPPPAYHNQQTRVKSKT